MSGVRRLGAATVVPVAAALVLAATALLAPAAAGAPFREPLDATCVERWAEVRPDAAESTYTGISAEWSWVTPGITCTHPVDGVFASPSAGDAASVGGLVLLLTAVLVAPAVVVARRLRSAP